MISDQDPQISSILKLAQTLNAQGLERLEQYAADLTETPKYAKKP